MEISKLADLILSESMLMESFNLKMKKEETDIEYPEEIQGRMIVSVINYKSLKLETLKLLATELNSIIDERISIINGIQDKLDSKDDVKNDNSGNDKKEV